MAQVFSLVHPFGSSFPSFKSFTLPAVSYAAIGSMFLARSHSEHCLRAWGWEMAYFMSDSGVEGRTIMQWETRKSCSATTLRS